MADIDQTAQRPNCCEGGNHGHTVKDNPEEFMNWLDKFADAASEFDFDDDEDDNDEDER